MHELEYAKKLDNTGWYVGVVNIDYLYLRKDLSIKKSTGHLDGYWETEAEANYARARYYFKTIRERINSEQTKEDFIVAYNFGKLLVEQTMNTWTFKLYGFHFTSNKNRKTPYGFNSKTWMIQDLSTIDKLKLILTGKMHRIKKCKKI